MSPRTVELSVLATDAPLITAYPADWPRSTVGVEAANADGTAGPKPAISKPPINAPRHINQRVRKLEDDVVPLIQRIQTDMSDPLPRGGGWPSPAVDFWSKHCIGYTPD